MASRTLDSPPAPSPEPLADVTVTTSWTCARCGAGVAIGESFVAAGTSTLILESLTRQHQSVCEAS